MHSNRLYVSDLAFEAEVGLEDPLRDDGQVLPLCQGQRPPFKIDLQQNNDKSAIQNRFTIENAEDA